MSVHPFRNRAEKMIAELPPSVRGVWQDWINEKSQKLRSFVGVDGEGGGTDAIGRQNYLLLRAGDCLLFNDNKRLTTLECLDFIASLEKSPIYCAYYFDYDVTQIIRDLDIRDMRRLVNREAVSEENASLYSGGIVWNGFKLDYIMKKFFRVRRTHPDDTHDHKVNPTITISDVGQFFQCKFAKALKDWNIASEETLRIIEQGKAARPTFETMTDIEIEYNKREVEMLAQLMEAFRDVCIESSYVPKQWQGPGWLAREILYKEGIPRRKDLAVKIPLELEEFANTAYYGGRFEIFKIGSLRNVYEYDISSAYPRAMLDLPCLTHGRWRRQMDIATSSHLYLADIEFRYRNDERTSCPLPIRLKKGSIYWPVTGRGRYWSWEIEADPALEVIKVHDCWSFEPSCDCKPFAGIEEIYNLRKKIGKSTKGYALKLGLNSIYGKLCQSVGKPTYANAIYGSLITAHCRAALIRASLQCDPDNLVMMATDGLFTTQPLTLDFGANIGQWEQKQHSEMFIVQPGVYFIENSERPKTRGVPMATLSALEDQFRSTFAEWMTDIKFDLLGFPLTFPYVTAELHSYIGAKLALARNKPMTAGSWIDIQKRITFDFRNKRQFGSLAADRSHINTRPYRGDPHVPTVFYRKDIGAWREDAALFELERGSGPDFYAFAPHEDAKLL